MGDGNFMWWYARSEDAESWGMAESRQDAIRAGKEEYEGAPFVIAEWDKTVCTPPHIDDLLEYFTECNEECWGEDGPDDPWDQDAINELEALVDAWFKKHPARTYMFDEQRNFEVITP